MHKLTSARSKPNIWKSPSFFFVGQTQPGLKKKKKLLKYWAIDKFEATQLEKLLNWNNSTSLPRNIDNTKRDAVFELQVCLRLIRDGLSCEEYSGVNYAIR